MLKPRVQVRNENGVLLAEFWDCLRLDPAPVQDLRKEFEAHLRAKGRPDLVVDLSGVGFAGSAALGGFLTLNRLARGRDGHMVFCNVDPTVYEVFRVSKLVPLFLFEPDLPSALAAVNKPPESAREKDKDKAKDGAPAPPAPADGHNASAPAPGPPKSTGGSGSNAPLRRTRRPSS